MRPYSCFVYFPKAGTLTPAGHNACWSMLMYKAGALIYIGDFDQPETQKYQDLLFGLINKITPCKIITTPKEPITEEVTDFFSWMRGRKRVKKTYLPIVDTADKRYIEFQMLDTYNKSLVLLNFIRNLWHEPMASYTEKFFAALERSGELYQDPMEQLTWANKDAISTCKYIYRPGHSNVHDHKLLKVKTAKQLLSYRGITTVSFLTQ